MLERHAHSRIVRWCMRAYLFHAGRTFHHFPSFLRRLSLGQAFGKHLQSLVRHYSERRQYHSTFFLRNRPELELMQRLLDSKSYGASVDISVIACSKGAEVYSIVWKIRSARPDLKLKIRAVDISQEVVDFAAAGTYSLSNGDEMKPSDRGEIGPTGDMTWKDQFWEQQPLSMFERMTSQEITEMFEVNGNQARIRPRLNQGITWFRGDAADPELVDILGLQDIVVANRFLCHMQPPAAEACLQNIARLVKPGGYLFVSGVDLDVRTAVAQNLNWRPVTEMIKEVHEGDWSLTQGWPVNYWGLEPFCSDRPDWKIRYASVFQIGAPS